MDNCCENNAYESRTICLTFPARCFVLPFLLIDIFIMSNLTNMIKTSPADKRFPSQNQATHCWCAILALFLFIFIHVPFQAALVFWAMLWWLPWAPCVTMSCCEVYQTRHFIYNAICTFELSWTWTILPLFNVMNIAGTGTTSGCFASRAPTGTTTRARACAKWLTPSALTLG